MSRRHTRRGFGFAGRAAVVTAALTAAATVGATAAGGVAAAPTAATWTINPGGTVSATSGRATFTDVFTGSKITCSSLTMSGTLSSGSGLPGHHAGSVSAVTFSNCIGTQGTAYTMQASGLPWHLNLLSYQSGVAAATLTNLRMTFSNPGCHALIAGSSGSGSDGMVRLSYVNSTGVLRVHTTGLVLFLYGVTGCAGLFHDNDPVALNTIVFTVSPKQAITSP